MKTNFVLINLLAFMLIFAATTLYAGPKLQITEGEYDFGIAPQHAKISHTFWLKSVGDETLKITKVVPGCGCTKAPLEKTELEPGDSTRLEVIFSTRTYKGRVNKSPKIHTNEGSAPKRVKIYTEVTPQPDSTYPLVIQPHKLDLSGRLEKEGDEIKFRIGNVSDQTVKLSLIDQPAGFFEISLPDKIGAGESIEIRLKANSASLEGSWEKSITIGAVAGEQSTRFSLPIKRKADLVSR